MRGFLSLLILVTIRVIFSDKTLPSTENIGLREDDIYETDLDRFLRINLSPNQIYLEINPPLTSDNRIRQIAERLSSGGIVLFEQQNFRSTCPSFESGNILCLQTHQQLSIDEILQHAFPDLPPSSLSTPSSNQIIPAIITISDFKFPFVANTSLVMTLRSMFYLQLNGSEDSKSIIDYFLSEGYDIFWHLSFSVDLKNAFPAQISETHFLTSHLSFAIVAIPISLSTPIFSILSTIFPKEHFFPFQLGKYSLADYGLQFLFEMGLPQWQEDNPLLTNLQITSTDWILNHWCQLSPSSTLHISPLFIGNHLNSLTEPPPETQNRLEFCHTIASSQATDSATATATAKALTSIELPLQALVSQTDLLIRAPMLYGGLLCSSLRFPSELRLTSTGFVEYSNFYCHQLKSYLSSKDCQEFITLFYQQSLLSHSQIFDPKAAPPENSDLDLRGVADPDSGLAPGLAPGSGSSPGVRVRRRTTAATAAAETAATTQSKKFFNPLHSLPFQRRTTLTCSDSLWCDQTIEFQRRLYLWQNPDSYEALSSPFVGRPHVDCKSAKFLVFEPHTTVHGIGSILLQIAIALRYALCHGRILYMTPISHMTQSETHRRWMMSMSSPSSPSSSYPSPSSYPSSYPSPSSSQTTNERKECNSSLLDCYFLSPTSCQLSEFDITNAWVVRGENIDSFPLKMSHVVSLTGLPITGKCSVCGSQWDGDFSFFDDLPLAQQTSFLGKIKLPWLAQMIRYLLRPQDWFSTKLQEIAEKHLSSPTNKLIPKPYASLHVRYGEKVIEVPQIPLQNYMEIILRKAPEIKDIFISTETEDVIHNLTRLYPEYRFHYLNQTRYEFIHTRPSATSIDFVSDFMFSMTNLFISIEADMFVGTLTSSWCSMIHGLQRTRGDGGRDYHSVDRGTSYTVCY